jgi:ABC-type glycerol-3-phosphate transport system substrate-binding protein
MATRSRRTLLKHMLGTSVAVIAAAVTGGCRARVPHDPSPIDLPAAIDSTPTASETVVAAEVPRAMERPSLPIRDRPTVAPTIAPSATATPATIPPVTLRADVLNYGWSRLAQQMTDAFQDAHPSLAVEWRSLTDWRDYPDRVAILRASGQLGDLVESPCATLTAAWALDGLLTDLGPVIEEDGFDTSQLFPGAVAAYTWWGQQVGLPLVTHGSDHVLLYDEEILEHVGSALPDDATTLEGLAAIAEQVAKGPDGLWGHILGTRAPEAYPLLRAFGADLLDATGAQCTIAEPEGRAFLTWLHRHVRQKRAAPSGPEIERGPTAMWQAGRVAMLHASLRHAAALISMQPERRIRVLALPPMPDVDKAPAVVSGVGYCIPATSRHASEALQWCKHMLSHETGVRLFAEGYAEPGSRMSCWQDSRVVSRFAASAPIAEVLARAAPERVPANLATEQCYQVWNAQIPRMLAGELSPEETADEIAAGLNAILDASARAR